MIDYAIILYRMILYYKTSMRQEAASALAGGGEDVVDPEFWSATSALQYDVL